MQFSDIRVFDAIEVYKNLGLEVGEAEYAALGFRVVVEMENTFLSLPSLLFAKNEPCEIVWYECGEQTGSLGQQPNQWFKITDGGKPPSGVETDWDDPTPCEGKFSKYWGDTPTIENTNGATKRLNFAVFVKGGQHCGAVQKKLLFHLDVTVKKRSVLINKTTFEPNPPVLKPGLANIEKCGEAEIANAIEFKG